MDRIIFHIGLHKTGSTALQHFLWNNRQKLAEFGLIYPEVGIDYFAHQNIAYDLNHDGRFDKNLGGFIELTEFCNSLDRGTVIISSENFEFCNKKSIQQIAQAFDIDKIEVIVYLRRQDQFLQSEYTQQVKHGYCTLEFEEFLEKHLHSERLNYIKYLEKWINVLSKKSVKVRIFEKSRLVNQNIIYDFLSLLPDYDITQSLAKSYKAYSTNNKPGYEIVELIRWLAQDLVDKKNMNKSLFSKKISQPILNSAILKDRYSKSFNKLNIENQSIIIEHFMSHNKSLVSLLSEDLLHQGLKNAFSTKIYSGVVTDRRISREEYTDMLSEVGLSTTLLNDTVV